MSTVRRESPDSAGTGIIDQLFRHRDAVERHLAAPRLVERENYLGSLMAAGYKRELVCDRASTLLLIVSRGWFQSATVTEQDFSDALDQLSGKQTPKGDKSLRPRGQFFLAVARDWTRFLGTYSRAAGALNLYQDELVQFTDWLRRDLGFLRTSTDSCTSGVKSFLVWLSRRHFSLSAVRQRDVDEFVAERRVSEYSRHSIISICLSVRTFFRYAELRGWNVGNLSKTVRAPRQRKAVHVMQCPPWRQVQRTIASLDKPDASHCRARAILLLAAIYGLRRSEICRLTLEDFDWRNEVLTVRRSKRGRTQQFPLQFEVGEAIIRYLRLRPRSNFREVFLTLQAPSRPATNLGCAMRKILTAQKTFTRPWGLHAFRHACATELLRKGTSLRGIADFLGHRGTHTVSVYAHSDMRALRDVARDPLDGLL